jgi:site-specific recombinase XerD
MIEKLFVVSEAAERHRGGLLGEHVDALFARMAPVGYVRSTLRRKLWLFAHLTRWMVRRGRPVADLDESLVQEFLSTRLGRRGRYRVGGAGERSTLRQLLQHLRAEGVIPCVAAPRDDSPVALLLGRYEHHLRSARALGERTVATYRSQIRGFLVDTFGAGEVDPRSLDARAVRDFLIRRAKTVGPRSLQHMGTALRSFSRFLFSQGETRLDLSPAVPTLTTWRLATVPRHLSPQEVERLLASCDRTTPRGRRDYAVLLLLARLGLRAGEVAALELADLRWRTGEIVVRGKGQAHDRLPMPPEVGRTLASYLAEDPRPGAPRRVFLRIHAPRLGLRCAKEVTRIVADAFARAGLPPGPHGAHVLRHSLATAMIRRGASMAEIGQVLRHRSPTTTEIYAKLDFDALRSVALPWPVHGGGR